MPMMTYEPKSSYNDKSVLSNGWHPGYLLAIEDQPKPPSWKNYEQAPRIWRWVFAVWEVPGLIGNQAPERQTAASEQKFAPAGKLRDGGTRSASKAYTWTQELLGREIQPGECVDLDPLMPLPCRIKMERNGEYVNIKDIERWPEGQALLTEAIKAQLRTLLDRGNEAQPAPQQPAMAPAPTPPQHPGMAAWGSTPQAHQAPPTGWPAQQPAQPTLPGTPPAQSRW